MRKKLILALLILALLASVSGCAKEPERFQKTYIDAFDTAITFIAYADSEEEFQAEAKKVHEELLKYHRLYDIYNEYSGLNNMYTINKAAGSGEPVVVDSEIIDMLEMAVEYYELSEGRMNIAMGSVLELWHNARKYGTAVPEDAKLPNMEKLEAASAHTDISKLVIDRESSTVYLEDPEMSLDVGSIAKGYATEMVAQMIAEDGWENAILNVGGNVRAIAAKPDGSGWAVGIQNPDLSDSENPYAELIGLQDMSLATSGVYQRYYTVDGRNYHHIIDSETLMPEDRYLSVSVITEHAGAADALSTVLFNMELEEGMAFAETLEGTEVMWVMPDETKYYSSGFENYISEE